MQKVIIRRDAVPVPRAPAGHAFASAGFRLSAAWPGSLLVHLAVAGLCWAGAEVAVVAPPAYEIRLTYLDEAEVPVAPDVLERPLFAEPPPVEESRPAPADLPAEPPPAMSPPVAIPAPAVVTPRPVVQVEEAPGPAAWLIASAPPVANVDLSESPAPVREEVAAPAPSVVDHGYWLAVRQDIARRIRYPYLPPGASLDTNVTLRITIDERGRLVGTQALDADEASPFVLAAARAVRRAAPFSPPRELDPSVPLTVELPVRFVRAKSTQGDT